MMNKIKSLILAAMCAALPLAFTACHSTPAHTAFVAESGAQVSVEAAMTAWGDYVAQFRPPAAQEVVVQQLYTRYQASMLTAIDATRSVVELTAAGSTNSIDANAKATLATQAAAKTLADLVGALRSFGLKL